jgi:hypothetical protein
MKTIYECSQSKSVKWITAIYIVALISYFDDEQFTRSMLRILLSLQHNMAGLNKKTIAELNTYYMKLIAVLADECAEWLKTLDK